MTYSQRRKPTEYSENSRNQDPSWFLDAANDLGRSRDLGPPRPARIRVDHPGYSELIEARPPRLATDPDSFWQDAEAPLPSRRPPRPAAARPPVRRLSLPATYAIAALSAVAAGAAAGFGASEAPAILAMLSQPDEITEEKPAVATPAQAVLPAFASVRKPVTTVGLTVADAEGTANTAIPLQVSAEDSSAPVEMVFRISGLPDDAYLTTGRQLPDKAWQITRHEARDVKLVLPPKVSDNIALAVAGFEAKSGDMLTPVKEITVDVSPAPQIVPVSAPPSSPSAATAAATAVPEPVSSIPSILARTQAPAQLLASGDRSWAAGDTVTARRHYDEAFAQGSADGAYRLGRTYDSRELAKAGLASNQANAELAAYWYRRAATAGSADAAAALRQMARPIAASP